MARRVKTTNTPHSTSSQQVEERLRARHIDFVLEPNLAIDMIVDAEGHQVRLAEHRAPTDMVSRFAEQMKAGAVFPAIVVNERNELIDGNTRKEAAVKAGRSTIAAYICRDLTPLQARSLSVELNQCHGLSMTEDEIHTFISSAVDEGQTLDTKTYARLTGVRPSTLERWKAGAMFRRRARRSGISDADVDALSESVQAALNPIRLTPVLFETTRLAVAARMSAVDLRHLVTRVNAAPSESAALAEVAKERDSRADDIRAIATGFAPRQRTGHRSAMHVAALLRIDPTDLVQVSPERLEDTLIRLRQLRDHLDLAIGAANGELQSTAPGAALSEAPSPALVTVGGLHG